ASGTDGKQTPIHSVPGEYVLLYFWDYNCGHCKKVTPRLAESFKQYKDKGVTLVTVSINGDVDVWKEKLKDYDLEGAINLQDHKRQSGFDRLYDIRSTPRLFILDKDRKILAKQISVETMEDLLNYELGIETEETEEEADSEKGKE
ncbi:MAG: TlpA disulfide reductase family protein, partial [Bacteroidota bacterium]